MRDERRDHFHSLAEVLTEALSPGEAFTCFLEGEDSEFIRFSQGRVRQAGNVVQSEVTVDLVDGERHAAGTCNLTGDFGVDADRLQRMVRSLRAQRAHLEPDPHLLYATEINHSERIVAGKSPDAATAATDIMEAADGMDLVGIWASGGILRGFANSFGQRNWHSTAGFNLDWSCYLRDDRAVKSSYAGFVWEPAEFNRRMDQARAQLEILNRPVKTLKPGRYRIFLAPSALQEILGMMAWGGFGLKSHRTLQTPLIQMVQEGKRLHPEISLSEHQAGGLAPDFTSSGFILPEYVPLIDRGEYRGYLVCARSAKEYAVPVNADSELPGSLDMVGGSLPREAVPEALDTGLYVNNLWYCNFSDRNHCCITGMTRYACFWVEDGEIRAPVNVMRFDESIYRMLGEHLLALTRERELFLDPSTYHQRSTATVRLPGALIADFALTL